MPAVFQADHYIPAPAAIQAGLGACLYCQFANSFSAFRAQINILIPAAPVVAFNLDHSAVICNPAGVACWKCGFWFGDDFHGLKPFQSGDSLRLIAWKRTAQTGELISREFQQHQGDKLLLDYSTVPLSDMEMKLSRLTAWVLKAQKLQLDYCLKLPGFDSGFGYSNEHYLKCLKALALFGLENETD